MDSQTHQDIIVTIRSPDQPGIIARVAPFFAERGCDIRESTVFGDPETKSFFVRMHLTAPASTVDQIARDFVPIAEELELDCRLYDQSQPLRLLIAVSKFDHCLHDLLHKWRARTLNIDICGVVSNHPDLHAMVEASGLPFHHLPVNAETKQAQEQQFLDIVDQSGAELVVLARYMQILSDDFAAQLAGRCINIHHSFLPSFKGARPYHQAYMRGVKLIGATAHFVSEDLDEGPIIEQDVRRVTHSTTPEEMIAIGHEVEASVLARAIKWYAERRVFLNANKAVVLAKS